MLLRYYVERVAEIGKQTCFFESVGYWTHRHGTALNIMGEQLHRRDRP